MGFFRLGSPALLISWACLIFRIVNGMSCYLELELLNLEGLEVLPHR